MAEKSGQFGPVQTDNNSAVTLWQWQESTDDTNWQNVGTILTDVSGQNTQTLTVRSAQLADNGTYVRCAASHPGGTEYSESAQLTVLEEDTDPPLNPEILFETNFSNDTGKQSFGTQLITETNMWGWDNERISDGGNIEVLAGEGVSGTNALLLYYTPHPYTTGGQGNNQPVINLFKHLSGNKNTGYDELYIRYKFRFSNDFTAGDGDEHTYWKWLRLWQNTHPDHTADGSWTENREDSGFVVCNFGASGTYGPRNGCAMAANVGDNLDKGSAGGEHYAVSWWDGAQPKNETRGMFEHIGAPDHNSAGDLTIDKATGYFIDRSNQDWHTVEYRVKLASGVDTWDGIYELWYDGLKQNPYPLLEEKYGAPPPPAISGDELVTMRKGSGFNSFSFFDNLTEWNIYWDQPGNDGRIRINDVVVSTSPIGHTYVAGNTDNTGTGAS